jgi:hypothetical protein
MISVLSMSEPRLGQPLSPARDPAAARVRHLVIDRMLRMNARHATHAWLHRRDQPVGPHGIAFLYLDAAPTPPAPGRPTDPPPAPRTTVAAATRLVHDAEETRSASRLLYRLAALAAERYAPLPGGFDPRRHMTNRQDPMHPAAPYVGLAVSSLDTAGATWEQTRRRVTGALDVPGRCLCLLTDGTLLLIERGGQDVYGEVRVACTHDLTVELGLSPRRWHWRPDLSSDPATSAVWPRLHDLHVLTMRGAARPGEENGPWR